VAGLTLHGDAQNMSGVRDAVAATLEAEPESDPTPVPKLERPGMPRFTTSKENVLAQFFIGSIDQGTTSSRFIIFDGTGQPVASHQHEFRQHYPESGWHEHDPLELVASVEACIKKASHAFLELGHDLDDLRAIGITNQRETALVWDYETGEPLYNAIAWPDTRTKGLVRDLKQREKDTGLNLASKTGMPLSTYPSAVKLMWLLNNVPKVKEAYESGRLAFGTVDTWLLYNLNGKDPRYFVTDSTNASRTMFMDLHTVKYDKELLNFFELDIDKLHLPRIVPSSDAKAYGTMATGMLAGKRIAGCLGDQSAALVGQQGKSTDLTYGLHRADH
jgi:glycerol kinase